MHIPVMLNETVDALEVKSGGRYIDGTLGGAGHSAEILRRAGSGTRLLGIDRDASALKRSAERLAEFPGQVVAVQGRHGEIARLARENGFEDVDGILLDLGVSSDQLDTPERGFSFRFEAPLDMRMDTDRGETAAQWLARQDVAQMAKVFREFGEEPQAFRIAKAIERERMKTPIETTGQLAGIVEAALGGRKGAPRHPATRVFQALRMAVNGEMDDLRDVLEGGLSLLKEGGCLVVITFESLTDRYVKQFFAAHEGKWTSLHQGGERWEGLEPAVIRTLRKAVQASDEEIAANPRARSAKLRAVKRTATPCRR